MINNKFILYLDLDGVLTSEDFIVYTHNCLTKHNTNKNKNSLHCRNFLRQYCFQQEGIDYLNKLYNEIPYHQQEDFSLSLMIGILYLI